jgi:hypothetical protein
MAQKSYGTIVSFGDQSTYSASTTWTPITQAIKVDPPEVSVDDIKTTNLTSPNEAHEYLPGFKEGGEGKITIQYAHTQTAALYALLGVQKGYKVILPDTHGIGFDGYIKSFGTPIDDEGIVTNDITFKVTGLPVVI